VVVPATEIGIGKVGRDEEIGAQDFSKKISEARLNGLTQTRQQQG